jgi:uncharacterized protein YeaO (DUF488 family)
MSIQLKRSYDKPAPRDGTRILVDRLWPRGVTKEKAKIDRWMKEIAPSTELRQWFAHDPEKWPEFRKRYRAELKGNEALAELKKVAKKQPVTLVYAAKDEVHNGAVVLKEILEK